MRKNKLDGGYAVSFNLLGIVSTSKEYQLAWHINETLGIRLTKQDDAIIEFSSGNPISIGYCHFETEYQFFSLIQNRLSAGSFNGRQLLLPEIKQFDYIVKFEDQIGEWNSVFIEERLKSIKLVQFTSQLNFEDLKSKENLLY